MNQNDILADEVIDIYEVSEDEKKRLLRKQNRLLIWTTLISTGVIGLATIPYIGQRLISASEINDAMFDEIMRDLGNIGWFSILGALAGILFIYLVKQGTLKAWKNPHPKKMTVQRFLMFLVVMMGFELVSLAIMNGAEFLLNRIGFTINGFLAEYESMFNSFSMILYAVIIAPIVEEIIYRGAFIRPLVKFGKVFAIVTSAILFSMAHGNLIQSPSALMSGILFGYLALEYSIVWPMVYHFINNAILSTLLPYVISLLNTQLHDPIYYVMYIGSFIGCVYVLMKHRQEIKAYLQENTTVPHSYRYLFVSFSGGILMLFFVFSLLDSITRL